MMKKYFALTIALLTSTLTCKVAAQEHEEPATETPTSFIFTAGIGSKSDLCTYLSPLRYSGTGISLGARWTRAMAANPEHLRMNFDLDLDGGITHNPRGSKSLYDAALRFNWGMNWTTMLPGKVRIFAGGKVGFEGGGMYIPYNGNNPATAIADVGLSLNVAAAWPFRLRKIPVLLSEEITLPTLSAFFSQQYGESYYEIYIGNRSGLVHPGWWGNHFGITSNLSADMMLGKCALRLGYRFEVRSSWECSINTQRVSHSFVVGLVYNPPAPFSSPSEKSRIINAIY